MGANPSLHRERIKEKLGEYLFAALQERSNESSVGRIVKREEKEIRKHFKAEWDLQKQKRESGEIGYIDFVNYL